MFQKLPLVIFNIFMWPSELFIAINGVTLKLNRSNIELLFLVTM